MAQTKIWPVTDHLARCVRYVMNPDKTQGGRLVSGVNLFIPFCDWQSPTSQMRKTKERFGKPGGRLAYHLEQSFKEGEVTPELAHKIGVELARELFGDRYEVVVATHVDKVHIHNHILLNSVSFADGKKFHQPNSFYENHIRKVSDALCQKYGLSIIKEAEPSHYESYPAQHHQEPHPSPTVHSAMYEDIDRAVGAARDMEGFYHILTEMGYRVKRDTAHPAIAPEGHGFFRLYKFKRGYTEEDIRRRIEEKSKAHAPSKVYGAWNNQKEFHFYQVRFTRYFARRLTMRSLRATYLHYRYLLRSVQRQTYPRYPSIDLRKEAAKLNRYSAQARLLAREKIDTQEDLQSFQKLLDEKIHTLNKKKWYLKRTLKKDITDEERQALKKQIEELEKQVRPLYRERFLCADIRKRSGVVDAETRREKVAARERLAQERGHTWTQRQKQ